MSDRLPAEWRTLTSWLLLIVITLATIGCNSNETNPTPATTGNPVDVAPITGAFLPLPSPQSAPRSDFTATTLADSRVLLAGGRGIGSATAADIFDPASETFEEVGPPLVTRGSHRAVLLNDGRVLLIGGLDTPPGASTVALDSTEIWSPATGKFTRAASMKRPRSAHAAVTLTDGRVLVSGGLTAPAVNGVQPTPLAAAELYHPATDRFSPVDPMNVARAHHQLTLLPDGRVLVSGGGPLEIYDPETNRFTRFEGDPTLGSEPTVATLLADGRVLITGVHTDTKSSDSDPEYARGAVIIDPAREELILVADMQVARSPAHTATLLPDGRVLVAGGAPGVSVPRLYPPSETFDPGTGSFRPIAFADDPEVPGGLGARNLATHLPTHTANRLPDGTVLVIGYEPRTTLVWAVERFDPAAPPGEDRFGALLAELALPAAARPGAVLTADSRPDGASRQPHQFGTFVEAAIAGGLQIRDLPATFFRGCDGGTDTGGGRIRAELPDGSRPYDFTLWVYPSVESLDEIWVTDEAGQTTPRPGSPCEQSVTVVFEYGGQVFINGNLLLFFGMPDAYFNERDDETRALLIEAFEATGTTED